ncbi:L-threonylcarbamoyladenylate synthase [Mediterraneibacter agrestimuris]|uniref:L-threonylcarbamoyladenylate synthase n=1 Tax=Mediterraneibacter agrestimuris TaxID=2941333 RepID=UPI00203C3DA1|nr:L-threonylcarbamoyladenylate synthase [Mediterraneibacter agrestimuris]
MKTIIKKTDEKNKDGQAIQEAGAILKAGGLVAFPTETVYGLGADALNADAAARTYAAKGRPSDNPLIVHIADMDALEKIAVDIPWSAVRLAENFWPGPLTMVFDKSEAVPYSTTGGLDTVAVRMPANQTAQELIRAAGGYVSAPSANTSGRPSPTTAEHVRVDLDGKIDMILDGGSVEIGLESTIVDMTVEPPMILRPGAVTAEMMEPVIGDVAIDETVLGSESNKAPKAPGMKYRHYAPKAKLIIVEGNIKEVVLAIRQLCYASVREGEKVGIMATGETICYYRHGVIKNIGSRENEKTIARNLYAVLREFDDEDVDVIYSESFAISGIGNAIMNRLEKAAGHLRISAREVTSRQKYRRIVFVSDTDTCRGPMAAELLRHRDLRQEYVIDSRGMIVLFPEPVNQKAEAVMKSARMTLAEHMATAFSEAEIDSEILLLTMNTSQKKKIASEYGTDISVYTLTEYVGVDGEILNPYGKALNSYGECMEKLSELIDKLTEKLNSFAEE